MREKMNELRVMLDKEIKQVETTGDLESLRVKYFGKKGYITEIASHMKDLKDEEKREFGQQLNSFKNDLEVLFYEKKNILSNIELAKALESEKIDVTLPSDNTNIGTLHPLTKITNEIEELFVSMGYDVVSGPELERDLYNFELLNLPKGHPARDAQDSFYITDEVLLRTQTSPVQIRTMIANQDKTPIRIICPGAVYRRDEDDRTHSHQFHQIEGLVVDENISMADLKGTLEIAMRHLFGEKRELRFRPSFFPFTEPSVEVDVSCFKCGGEGCALCKGTGWIEVLGSGLVHPNVLRNCGYDPKKYSGFAFGFGPERIAMLKYGISDIRSFYTNDLRFLSDFSKKDGDN